MPYNLTILVLTLGLSVVFATVMAVAAAGVAWTDHGRISTVVKWAGTAFVATLTLAVSILALVLSALHQ